MQFVKPKVYLIAKTVVMRGTLQRFLEDIGAPDWQSDGETDAEKLAEVAGRLCYNSFKPGLNPNVTKIREGNKEYLANILAQNHGSVLEHATVSFIFHNVSRVFTHELVRHRVGTAISQESLRYVRVTDIKFYKPDCIDEEELSVWATIIQTLQDFYGSRAAKLDGKNFSIKKLFTSALRRMLPEGMCTTVLWTTNFRNLRHVILQRTALGAEEEIRQVFDEVALRVVGLYPNIFQDFKRGSDGTWTI